MTYIGFNVDDSVIEKLKIISFMTGRTRSDLLKEGVDSVINIYSEEFKEFKKYANNIQEG